jgi:hypothetical protein
MQEANMDTNALVPQAFVLREINADALALIKS